MTKTAAWRVPLALSGVALVLGGPRHPSPHLDLPFAESTARMLADPAWVPSHVLLLLGYLLMLAGLVLWRRSVDLPPKAAGWLRFTLVVLAVCVVEMIFHTASVADLARLEAGRATPILTTHLVLAMVANPLLTIGLAGLALRAGQLGVLGSRWIAWLPVGALLYGAASFYVVATHDQRVSPLFAIGSAFLALWLILVAAWPLRPRAAAG